MWRVGGNLLDHHHGKQLNKKVDGVMKQTVSLISSCCASPEALTYDSLTDWASQEEQREISGREQSKLMKIQIDRSHNRITPSWVPVLWLLWGSCGTGGSPLTPWTAVLVSKCPWASVAEGWLRQAVLPLANMLHHCELRHTHRWWWWCNPFRYSPTGTPGLRVSP